MTEDEMKNNVMEGDFFTELDLAERVERMLAMHVLDDEARAKLIDIADRYRKLTSEFWDVLRQVIGT